MNLKLSLEIAPFTRIGCILCSELAHRLLTPYHIKPLEPFQKVSLGLTTIRRQKTPIFPLSFWMNVSGLGNVLRILSLHKVLPQPQEPHTSKQKQCGTKHPLGCSMEFEVTEPERHKHNRKVQACSLCHLNFRVSFWHVKDWKCSKWVSRTDVPTPLTLWTQDVKFTGNLQKVLNMGAFNSKRKWKPGNQEQS